MTASKPSRRREKEVSLLISTLWMRRQARFRKALHCPMITVNEWRANKCIDFNSMQGVEVRAYGSGRHGEKDKLEAWREVFMKT